MGELANQQLLLGVNLDHVATLRQARLTPYPDLLAAVTIVENAGADGITLHLREDKRHIQPQDVVAVQAMVRTRLNLEMAVTQPMVEFALQVKPAHCCLVPEKRAELTTEDGLNVVAQRELIKTAVHTLLAAGITVSLFIAPDPRQIMAAVACGAPAIELHTGYYVHAHNAQAQNTELLRLQQAVALGREHNLLVNAGHGLHYTNVNPIVALDGIYELNIGHSIVSRAVFVGLAQAVREMKDLLNKRTS